MCNSKFVFFLKWLISHIIGKSEIDFFYLYRVQAETYVGVGRSWLWQIEGLGLEKRTMLAHIFQCVAGCTLDASTQTHSSPPTQATGTNNLSLGLSSIELRWARRVHRRMTPNLPSGSTCLPSHRASSTPNHRSSNNPMDPPSDTPPIRPALLAAVTPASGVAAPPQLSPRLKISFITKFRRSPSTIPNLSPTPLGFPENDTAMRYIYVSG